MNRQLKSGKQKKKLTSNERICSEVSVNSPWGIRGVSPEEEKEGYGGKDLQKREVVGLSLPFENPA